jgi:hypothetical protein
MRRERRRDLKDCNKWKAVRGRGPICFLSLLLALLLSGDPASGKAGSTDDVRVLFIGNSLTYSNNLPSIIQAMAEANGKKFIHKSVAYGGFSLEDHWQQGEARSEIHAGQWQMVVLQQGPSARPESRALLIKYASLFAKEINRAGAIPVLYMVWPSVMRSVDFGSVSESYSLTAKEVKGLLVPVGEAWRRAMNQDSGLSLYATDGLHPTDQGSYLAALVFYGKLFNGPPAQLPTCLELRTNKAGKICLPQKKIDALQLAAIEANGKF